MFTEKKIVDSKQFYENLSIADILKFEFIIIRCKLKIIFKNNTECYY